MISLNYLFDNATKHKYSFEFCIKSAENGFSYNLINILRKLFDNLRL